MMGLFIPMSLLVTSEPSVACHNLKAIVEVATLG